MFVRRPSNLNEENYSKKQSKYLNLRTSSIKTYVERMTNLEIISKKLFWRTVRTFPTNNGVFIKTKFL